MAFDIDPNKNYLRRYPKGPAFGKNGLPFRTMPQDPLENADPLGVPFAKHQQFAKPDLPIDAPTFEPTVADVAASMVATTSNFDVSPPPTVSEPTTELDYRQMFVDAQKALARGEQNATRFAISPRGMNTRSAQPGMSGGSAALDWANSDERINLINERKLARDLMLKGSFIDNQNVNMEERQQKAAAAQAYMSEAARNGAEVNMLGQEISATGTPGGRSGRSPEDMQELLDWLLNNSKAKKG